MHDLMKLQRTLQHSLLHDQSMIDEPVMENDIFNNHQRLAIYRNAYYSRLHKALETNYPALAIYMGKDVFKRLSTNYIHHYPSSFHSLRWFGDKLPTYLQHHYSQYYPFLSELAAFEWQLSLSLDAADAPVVQLAELAAISPSGWSDMGLVFHPSVARLTFFWSVVTLRHALMNQETAIFPTKSLESTTWIIWRFNHATYYYDLSVEENWMLSNLQAGMTFAQVCEGLCEWMPQETVGTYTAGLLKKWIEVGLLTAIKIN